MKIFQSALLRLLKIALLFFLLAVALIFVYKKFDLSKTFGGWFASKPLLIENTPLVITQIRSIAELQTAQLYAEIVADSTIVSSVGATNDALARIGLISLPVNFNQKLVLVVKGKVIAGIDLKLLTSDRIFIKDDSVSISLPPARYLEVVTNPSDFETFLEQGTWTDAAVQAVKNKARRQLLEKANQQQLLQQATTQSSAAIEQMMRSFGFKKVSVTTIKP